ncbi:MAG: serine/threonine protein kinase [Bacteroidaceae bacterium]|nr:serine/threonine protein kinase [Bacteroidaceae bacterium]
MLEIGSLVDGKYKILNKVGQGGMSVVYLAMNEKANKQWAVKEVRKDGIRDFEVVKQGLVAETDILKKLNHPHLPSIIDVIDTDESFIIIMDYIQGNSLNKALDEYGAQPQENVITWAKQLCDVLNYLHTRNPAIIYRDMKPANVMLKPDGNVTLIDFGTAREYKEKNLADTTCLGTVGYAAPEQFGGMGQTDARTDIYCLGATLYHLVTGMNPCEPPYEIKPIREINPGLSAGLERIILKCTQRDPNDRYQSAAELMYALEHYKEDDDDFRRKQKKKLASVIATLTLSLAFGAVSIWGYTAAEKQKAADYDQKLLAADTVEKYYDAILTDPTRTEAYLQFNDFLASDYTLNRDEWGNHQKLFAGFDKTLIGGFKQTIYVLDELKSSNPEGYAEVCFNMGWNVLSYYETDIDRVRYENAAKWFQYIRDDGTENGNVAAIFCDISQCVTKINELHGSKVIQTQALRQQRENLWKMLQDLNSKSERYEPDYKLLIWLEIDKLINGNINDFAEVTDPSAMITILKEIQNGAAAIDASNPDIQKLVKQLQDSTAATIFRVETVQ